MRVILALFVVLFVAAGLAAMIVMQTELRYLAGILGLGFAVVAAGLGGIIDEQVRLRHQVTRPPSQR